MNGKPELRQLARARLRALTSAQLAEKSARMVEHILQSPEWPDARVVGLFAAQATEPDLGELWRHAAGRTFCYPRVNGVQLDLLRVENAAELKTSRWQLREPIHDDAKLVAPAELDLIFVPGLAFTAEGVRLGRGGGFYDRLLAAPTLRARKIGVCFDTQIFAEIPREPHDCLLDSLLTESGPIQNPNSKIQNPIIPARTSGTSESA